MAPVGMGGQARMSRASGASSIPCRLDAMSTRALGSTQASGALNAPAGLGNSHPFHAAESVVEVDAIRSVVRGALDGCPGVELAVLFGSAARGGTRARDLDIGVWLTADDTSELLSINTALGRALRRPVDLTLLNTAPPLLPFEVARDGAVLIERRPGAWTDFRTRAMLDRWDWAPTARRLFATAAERLRERK
jgi:predicted nucleotidyltransferase